MIRHVQRGGWWSFLTGWVAQTLTKANRLATCSPAGVVRHESVVHAVSESRSASVRTDSGFRSGRAAVGGRPVVPSRFGTAKIVSGPYTLPLAETATR